jgi:hypothetical protein
MAHDVQAIREDLAFMRALAQEGRRAPLLIGHNLVVGGIVYATTSLFAWAVATRLLNLPAWSQGAAYVGVTVVYVAYARLRRRACAASGRPGATAITNRAVSAAWRGVGFALLALMFAAFAIAYETHSAMVFVLFPSIVMAIYGAGWTVAAVMSEVRWLKWAAAGCFVSAALFGLAADSINLYLMFAASMLLLAALPGWLLVRGEPSEVV